jgi:hypothetical protein
MAKKAAAKKKAPKDGSDPNALGLEGPGVSVVRIASITKAINEYEEIKTQRCALTPQEVKTKQKVIELMEKNADKLRNPNTGCLEYHLDDNRYVVIEPAKVKIKFKDEKPAKTRKGKTEDLEPEQQQAQDEAD